MPDVCTCGLIRQEKAGTSTRDGRLYCNHCGKPIPRQPTATQVQAAITPQVPNERITTLPSLPGHVIVRCVGIASILAGSAGLSATMKGNDALDAALHQLRERATEMGGNAVIGLTGSTFGAGGGLTNVFGGDAVGVLLLGTVVVVRPDDPQPTPAQAP